METYPANFPCPRMDPYSWSVDMGVLRTPMDGGYARQRRLYDVMPHTFTLQFTVSLALLGAWQDWVNQNAYDYFELPLWSFESSPSKVATLHIARFTSNLEMTLVDKTMVQVSVQAERAPNEVTPLLSRSQDWQPAPPPAEEASS